MILRVFSLFLVLAAVALASSGLSAQEAARVRHRELAASGAPLLYDAVAHTRPAWLPQGGTGRVAVFVNGTYAGDATRLRTLVTDSVASVRWSLAEHVSQKFNRYPAGEFDAVLFVTTRGTGPAQRGRFTVSLDVGMSVASMPSAAQHALEKAGYDQDQRYSGALGSAQTFQDQGARMPVVVGGTLHYRVADAWGVALTGVHTRAGWAGGYSGDAGRALSTSATSSEGALMVTADHNTLRVGLGPVYQRADWEWATGFCQCNNEWSSSSASLGAAAEVLTALPIERLPVRPLVRILGRYYPAREIEYGASGERMEIGGFMVTLGVSLATQF